MLRQVRQKASPIAFFAVTLMLSVTTFGQRALDCWMTGGGSIFDPNGRIGDVVFTGRTTHGFELHCDTRNPNNLEINWLGNRFHLQELSGAVCSDDPNIAPNPPGASFDTFTGFGRGRYNGVPGYCANWTFTDAGEPGTADTAEIVIVECGTTNTVLSIGPSPLTFGNHQAHSQGS